MFNNQLRTVLITGSTGGIGRGIVVAFAKKHWNVLCHYNCEDERKVELEQYLKKNNYDHYFFKYDFLDKDNLDYFIHEISLFKIDSLINNAGIYIEGFSYEKNNLSDVIDVFMVNCFVPMMIASKCFYEMKIRKFGRIVNIGSIAAKYGSSFKSMPYGCSKRAIEGVTKSLAKEGAKYNVLINTIRPGVIDTHFNEKSLKDMNGRVSIIPMQKMGEPKDIANMVYYIGSSDNEFITNEVITIAGGE